MTNEQLKDICEALGWQGGTIYQALGEIKMLRAEHFERMTLQHHAADQAQRIAELEAVVSEPRGTDDQIAKERELAHAAIDGALAFGYQGVDSPAAGHWLLGAHKAGKRIAELEAERDELRARLAELEQQGPVTWRRMGCGSSEPLEDLQARGHIACCPEREMRHLYARPVPAIPAGWKPVPADPTEEMILAGYDTHDTTPAGIYRAQVAAAPEAAR